MTAKTMLTGNGILLLLLLTVYNASAQRTAPWQHPIFKAIEARFPGIRIFENACKGCGANLAVVDTLTKRLYILTRNGLVYDSLALDAVAYRQIVELQTLSPFVVAQQVINKAIADAEKQKRLIRSHAPKRLTFSVQPGKASNQLVINLQKCKTQLEQLQAIDAYTEPLYQARLMFTYDLYQQPEAASRQIMADSSTTARLMRQFSAADSGMVVFENPYRFSTISHALLNSGTGTLVFSNQLGAVIDSFGINTAHLADLKKGVVNPFFLYRGWLEAHLHQFTGYKIAVEKEIAVINAALRQQGVDSTVKAGYEADKAAVIAWVAQNIQALETRVNQLNQPDGLQVFGNYDVNKEMKRWNGQTFSEPADRKLTYTRGVKKYELTNHLGNVLATISDRKTPGGTVGSAVTYYKADVVTATDYYPFGMAMPGRTFTAGDADYRYGFNGKENDNDVKGPGNQQDYGFRIYDPRLGKFLSVDPLMKEYPELTLYQFASNTPLQAIDLDGLEKFYYARSTNDKGETILTPISSEPLVENKKILVGYTTPRSAMADPQPVYETVKEVNARQEYIVYSPIERPICRAGNVTWQTYEGVATYKSYEEALNSKTSDFKMQNGDLWLHYSVQGLINIGDEYKEGNAQSMKTLTTSATNKQVVAANNGNKSSTRTSYDNHGSETLDIAPMTESRLGGRVLIIDENISPAIIKPLKDAGFFVKRFPAGTKDKDIIAAAKQNNSIVLTNNIKDFKKSGVTSIKVTALQQKNNSLIVEQMKKVDQTIKNNPSVGSKGKTISLANPGG